MRTTDEVKVSLTGMTCASCERRVGKALRRLPGVEDVSVSATRGTAVLRGDRLPDRAAIDAAVRRAGYEPSAPAWVTRDPAVWRTVGIAAAVVAALAALVLTLVPGSVMSGLTSPERGGLLLVLVLGLTAGVSTCMALVGGLVLGFSAAHSSALAASGRTGLPFTTRIRPQLAFNAGRIVGFGVLGVGLGSLGSTMSPPIRVMAVLVLAVAVVMFLLGVRLTGVSPRVAGWSPRLPAGIGRLLGVDTATQRAYSHGRTAVVGAATFFLPCGFTQAVQIYALSTASAVSAGLIMAVFAVGTTPGLLALGSVPEVVQGERQASVLRVVGVVVLAFALVNLSSGVNLLGISTGSTTTARVASDNVTLADGVQTVRMTQTSGYEPAETVLYAGVPTRWVIESESPFDCSAFIRVPSLGLQVDLQPGRNTVELPPLDSGTVPFTCVMGMYSGTLVVIDQPSAAATD
jgi:uncharacterized protein